MDKNNSIEDRTDIMHFKLCENKRTEYFNYWKILPLDCEILLKERRATNKENCYCRIRRMVTFLSGRYVLSSN